MRFSERNGRDGGMDETATGFIDIQFGLIAILILLLSTAVTGIGNLSNQLRGVEGGMSGIIDLLLCDWNGEPANCEPGDHNRFEGHRGSEIELIRPGQEMVLVLGMTSEDRGTGLFPLGEQAFPVPPNIRREAMTTIRDRINRILPCFAPFSRSTPDLRARADQSRRDCVEVLLLGRFSERAAPGIDLFQIEGHGDNVPFGTGADPRLAMNRAQAVLYSLLVEPRANEGPLALIQRINQFDARRIADELDRIIQPSSSTTLGDLFWLAPLGARITEECRLGRELRQDLPEWCQGLLPEGQPRGTPNLESRLPKLFAMTSYGRFSLRYGDRANTAGDPRDRRVEFRLRGSIIPTGIHDLFTDPEGPYFNNTGLFRLYSTDAVMALHQCDATRESNQGCLVDLDRLTMSD